MLQAMNTGHEGSLTTVHANSPDDALSRLETLSSMSDVEIPFHAIRDQVNSAIDVIVQLNRQSDGARRVVETCFVASRRQEDFSLVPLVTWDSLHVDEVARTRGRFVVHAVPEGLRHRFLEANVEIPQFMRSAP